MSTHARLPPSGRYRWSRCAASVNACAKYETGGKSSLASIDGTHSHTLLEHCLKHKGGIVDPKTFMGTVLSDHEGMFGVDMDRCQRVQIAVDYIRQAEAAGATILSETRVNPSDLVGRDDMGGTADVQVFWPNNEIVELIDYKDGMTRVTAEGNEQLEQYALGVIAEAIKKGRTFDTVRMTIIQPKVAIKGGNPISTHDVSVLSLLGKIPQIMAEAEATDDPNAPFTPGKKQCSYCPNRGNCSAHNSHVLGASGIKFDKVEFSKQAAVEPNEMTDEKLREIIEAAPMLRQLIEAAEAEALRRIESGNTVSGLKVVRGVGRRGWRFDEDQTAAKLSKMGVPKGDIWRTVLVSPAQAEKLTWTKRDGTTKQLTEKQLAVLHGEMITKGDGKLTVVPESDRREAITFQKLEGVFEPVIQNGDDLPDWLK